MSLKDLKKLMYYLTYVLSKTLTYLKIIYGFQYFDIKLYFLICNTMSTNSK